MSSPSIQLGLFGKATVADHHVVSAHTRVLADGTEVFVGEHLRWNRPRRPRGPRRPRPAPATDPRQGDLFAPALPWELDEVEVWPGAWQLPLWRRG